jgi:hypothetical protein
MNYPKSNRLPGKTQSAEPWIREGLGKPGLDADARVAIDHPPGSAERWLGIVSDMLKQGLSSGICGGGRHGRLSAMHIVEEARRRKPFLECGGLPPRMERNGNPEEDL